MPNSPPAINHLCLQLPSLFGGGAERFAVNLAIEMHRRGIRVDFLLSHFAGPFCEAVPAGVKVIELGSTAFRRKFGGMCRYLRTDRPQAVITSLDISNVVGLARWYTRTPTRVAMVVHNTLSQELRLGSASRRRVFRIARHLYRLADDVIAVSEGTAEDTATLIPSIRQKLKVIYNPVITADLLSAATEPVAHPWFVPGGPPVILGAGRIMPQKDFPTLVRAFRILRDRRRARLIILGDGGRDELRTLIGQLGLADDTDLPGFVANPAAWMAKADVFALSSVWEGLGNVIIEALAVGTPVVSTNCPHGPSETLADGRYGRLVPVGDAAALAAALEATLDEPRRTDALKARGAEYTVASATDAYLSVIAHGLSNAAGPAPLRARAAFRRKSK